MAATLQRLELHEQRLELREQGFEFGFELIDERHVIQFEFVHLKLLDLQRVVVVWHVKVRLTAPAAAASSARRRGRAVDARVRAFVPNRSRT